MPSSGSRSEMDDLSSLMSESEIKAYYQQVTENLMKGTDINDCTEIECPLCKEMIVQ